MTDPSTQLIIDTVLKTASLSERQEELLEAGSCCGENCRVCPYMPKRQKGARTVDPAVHAKKNAPDLEKAANGPSLGRAVGVGLAGALPASLLGSVGAVGVGALAENSGKDVDPKLLHLIQKLMVFGSGAAGGMLAQRLDGQHDPSKWDGKKKIDAPDLEKEARGQGLGKILKMLGSGNPGTIAQEAATGFGSAARAIPGRTGMTRPAAGVGFAPSVGREITPRGQQAVSFLRGTGGAVAGYAASDPLADYFYNPMLDLVEEGSELNYLGRSTEKVINTIMGASLATLTRGKAKLPMIARKAALGGVPLAAHYGSNILQSGSRLTGNVAEATDSFNTKDEDTGETAAQAISGSLVEAAKGWGESMGTFGRDAAAKKAIPKLTQLIADYEKKIATTRARDGTWMTVEKLDAKTSGAYYAKLLEELAGHKEQLANSWAQKGREWFGDTAGGLSNIFGSPAVRKALTAKVNAGTATAAEVAELKHLDGTSLPGVVKNFGDKLEATGETIAQAPNRVADLLEGLAKNAPVIGGMSAGLFAGNLAGDLTAGRATTPEAIRRNNRRRAVTLLLGGIGGGVTGWGAGTEEGRQAFSGLGARAQEGAANVSTLAQEFLSRIRDRGA